MIVSVVLEDIGAVDGVGANSVVVGDSGEVGDGAITIVRDKDWLAVAPLLSVAWSVKVDIPDVVGEPEIVPVLAFNRRPLGNVPDVIDQV